MGAYVKIVLFPYFRFLVVEHDSSDAQILPVYAYCSFKHSQWWRHKL